MKLKKILTPIIVVLVITGLIVGGVFGFRAIKKGKKVVDVTSVSYLNMGYYTSSLESEGTVTSDSAQSVFVEASQTINEVFVEEGDTVSIGDPLVEFDLTSLALSIEVKRLTIESQRYQLEGLKRELAELQNKKVGDPKVAAVTTPSEATTTVAVTAVANPFSAAQQMYAADNGSAISALTSAYNFDTVDGSSEANAYRFLCNADSCVSGALLNELSDNGYFAYFEVRDGNTASGTLLLSVFINGSSLDSYDDDAVISIFPQENGGSDDNGGGENGGGENGGDEPFDDPSNYYTAQELAIAIRDKTQEIAVADLALRQAELALAQMEEAAADGIVYAKINGTVKTCHAIDDVPSDGSAFINIAGSDGMYIRGGIDEMNRDNISVGQTVSAYNWETGDYIYGTIASIDDFPSTDVYCYSSSNPNCSTYAYTAYFEDVGSMSVGQWVELTIESEGEVSDSIYIEKAYVRTDSEGHSYVYKDDNGVLVKQYVSTGAILWGSYIEIKSGITLEDMIAFPYGDAAEGVRTQESVGGYYGG